MNADPRHPLDNYLESVERKYFKRRIQNHFALMASHLGFRMHLHIICIKKFLAGLANNSIS